MGGRPEDVGLSSERLARIDRHLQERYIEPGKIADVVVWSGTPWSVYTQVDLTYVDGRLLYDRSRPQTWPSVDFEVGLGVSP